jgi:hypothetical protein
MARDLATLSNFCVLLDFDEGADLGFVAHFAPIQVDKLGQLNTLPQLYIRGNTHIWIHNGKIFIGSFLGYFH